MIISYLSSLELFECSLEFIEYNKFKLIANKSERLKVTREFQISSIKSYAFLLLFL